MGSYYYNQLKAMVKRNFLLKKVNRSNFFVEILFPLMFAFLGLSMVKNNKVENYLNHEPTPLEDLENIQLESEISSMNNTAIGFILPQNNQDETIISKVMSFNGISGKEIKAVQFKDQEQMESFNKVLGNNLIAGVIFESDDYLHYTIRVDGSSIPSPDDQAQLNYAYARNQAEKGSIPSDTYKHIFAPVQAAVDQAIIRLKTKDDSFNLEHRVGKLGKPPVKYAVVDAASSNNLAYEISAMFILSIISIVTSLVQEKENKIKDGLLIAGVHPTIFWLSWLIIYIAFSVVIGILVTAIFTLFNAFSGLNPIILFFAIFLYGLSCCNLAFLLSTFFKKTKTAGTVVGIVVIVLIFTNMVTSYININIRVILSFLFSPISIGSFINEVFSMHINAQSVSFGNLFKCNAGMFLLGLLFSNILYFVLAVLSDNAFSGDGGYLFRKDIKVKDFHDDEVEATYGKDIQEDFNAKRNEKCRVEVSHIHKVFKRKNDKNDGDAQEKNIKNDEFLANNDISFKVYDNEIFAILGHNGAGKTTLINIMIGILKASYGDVYFDGRSVSSNLKEVRKDFGVCAQHNIIYDELTVQDHINFYADLKSVTVDVDEVLTELDLIHQKEVKASKLSGGQKRKLCIGMATIGNPKYIFLDEPTTGLDPLSRRKIWELLLKKKEGRVIFLTTHYMDEADILADRKLILNKGNIRCLGTSLYLKNHFNMSYSLDIETENKDYIDKLIKSYLPEATYYTNPEDAMVENPIKCHSWKLPLNSTTHFSSLMNELDNQKNNNTIQKYALTMPTLEELFIRLEDDNLDVFNANGDGNEKQHLIQTETELPRLRSVAMPSRMNQLLCLSKYRLKMFLKDKAFAFNSVITAILLAGLTFFFFNWLINSSSSSSSSKVISVPDTYSNTLVNYDSNSTLIIPQEHMITALNSDKALTSMPLRDIPYPEPNDAYYLSSITAEKTNNNTDSFQVYYNDTMTHAIPATFNAISNAILASNNVKEQIVVSSHPFNRSNEILTILGLSIAGVMLGMCFISPLSKFGPMATHERVNQLLQQLQLNGVSRINYWISCFMSDNLIFLVTCILIVVAGVVVRFEPLLDIQILLIIFVALIIWSIPTLFYQYILSFFFNKEESAITYINMLNTYSVIIGYVIFMMVDSFSSNKIELLINYKGIFSMASIIINLVLTFLFPAYGIIGITNALFNIKIYGKFYNYEFSLKNILYYRNGISPLVILLLILAVVYFYILIKMDQMNNQTNKKDIHEFPLDTKTHYEDVLREGDDDVYNEFEYVKEHQMDLPISVLHLSKEFKVPKPNKEKAELYLQNDKVKFTHGQIHPSMFTGKLVKTAVIDVNFGVRNHECFGLLGPNGAGKSTTLNTITSTIPQTTGTICFNGVETHLARLGEISLGYCPQKDILWKELTLREHIELFLNIRGYSNEESKKYATQYIEVAGLEEHQHKRIENLSGGTKRKLSLLIAICGYPEQILLDEPTAGMDPSTRRLIWNIILKTKSMNDSALILTTHSMEEAENLCDRLAILVNGRLICIGSPEHLKMKYGEGYVLELQSEDIDRFHKEIIEGRKIFGDKEYKMERSSENRAKYEVKMNSNFGNVFDVMEQCKSEGLVQDYSFSQTSLEQVFINFAKQQIIDTNN